MSAASETRQETRGRPGGGFQDAKAREAICQDVEAPMFVEAGAGSGKTSALVSRVVEIVSSGRAALTEIAAITFTELAAAELRDRVRRELEAAALAPEASCERRSRISVALERIDEAVITTIHGFCNGVLSEHPVEAGLPPRFEVLDEVRQDLAWRSEWSAMIDALGADPDGAALFEVAALLGLKTYRLQQLYQALSAQWHSCTETPSGAKDVVLAVRALVEVAARDVGEAFSEAAGAAAARPDADDSLAEKCADAGRLAGLLASSSDWRDSLAVMAAESCVIRASNAGSKEVWGDLRLDIRESLCRAQAVREELLTEAVDQVGRELALLFGTFAERAARARCQSGLLLYHDLLVLAREVLGEVPEVRLAVQDRFKFLLVDEFQDTDPLQLEIAELVAPGAGAPGSGAGAPGVGPAGELFRVGDPQQAIYSFRGADIEAYLDARERFRATGAEVTTLTANFRSVPGVLAFVNECAAGLLPGFNALEAVRSSPGAAPVVHFVGGPLDKALRADDRRALEAADCAALIRKAMRESWRVRSGGLPSERDGPTLVAPHGEPLAYSDVAILVPRRTGLSQIEAALDAVGIGYRVESADLIYRSQEVRDLLALCRVVGSPGDHAAVVAVLRSSLFRCADDELFEYRRSGGDWSIDDARPPAAGEGASDGPGRVARALFELRGFRDICEASGPVAAFERALSQRQILQLGAVGPHPRESWRRVRFFVEGLRRFVSASGAGIVDYADWVDEQLAENLRPAESLAPELDEDVVRIMTVHAAKGLEFPVTFLVGFGTTAQSPIRPVVLPEESGRFQVNFNSSRKTAGYEALDAVRQAAERAEEMRLVYVAATRAMDHLVVCAHRPERPASAESKASVFEEFCHAAFEARDRVPDLFEIVDLDGPDLAPPGPPGGAGASPGPPRGGAGGSSRNGVGTTVEAFEEFCRQREDLARRASRPWHVSATEVGALPVGGGTEPGAGTGPAANGPTSFGAGEDLAGARTFSEEGEREEGFAGASGHSFRRRGRAGTQIGRAVHAGLQSLPLEVMRVLARDAGRAPREAASLLERTCMVHAATEGIVGRAGEVERLVRAALSSPAVREALAADEVRREVYVSTSVASLVLDGYVDLCYETPRGYVVVDYKTDSVRDLAEAEQLLPRYGLQVATYALALEEVVGRPVARAVLVFLAPPGQPIEISVRDLPAAVAKVRRLVSAVAGA